MPSYTRQSPDAPKTRTHGTVRPCGIPKAAREKEREMLEKRKAQAALVEQPETPNS